VNPACNPRSSGSGDWEDGGLGPAWEKSYQDFISINKSGVMVSAMWEVQVEGAGVKLALSQYEDLI
jgi:hypothetical protein